MRTFIFALTFILSGLDLIAQADTTYSPVYCWGIDEHDAAAEPAKPTALRRFFKTVTTYRPRCRLILPAALAFSSGAAWGTHETLMHHNERFFRVFPGASRRFWGPESWKNKYWGFNPENGRNNTLVYFTDAKHLLASGTQVLGFSAGAVITMGDDRPFFHYLFDAGVSFVAYTAGNLVTYNLLFR